MRISVLGLGKLGSPLAAVLADCGHDVIGVDTRPETVALLEQGLAPVAEPQLQDLISRNRARLRATTDAAAAAAASDVTVIIVPTPSTPSGTFSLDFVRDAVTNVGRGLRQSSAYHVVAVTSTVAPLSMEREILPLLEQASGRAVGDSIGLCYSPEFIALGSVIHDMRHPDFVLIGQSDDRAGALFESVQRSMVGNTVPVRRMSLTNAELAKLAVNTFVTTKISYANMLAELCERLPGADVDVVTEAIGNDRRIGHRYFKGTVGYGGPCFPRDNVAFCAVAASVGLTADLAEATDTVNRRQPARLAAFVRAQCDERGSRIGILGLSYKPGTHVVEESQALQLTNQLAREGMAVVAYDPAAAAEAEPHLAPGVHLAESLAEVLARADVIVVAVPWQEFIELPTMLERAPRRPRTVIDCWRLLDPRQLGDDITVVYPGRKEARAVPDALSTGADANGR